MSINDPKWGNSHRPDQEEPEQAEQSSDISVHSEPEDKTHTQESPKNGLRPHKTSSDGPPDLEELWQNFLYRIRCKVSEILRKTTQAPSDSYKTSSYSAQTDKNKKCSARSATQNSSFQIFCLKNWTISIGLILSSWFMSGLYVVEVNQRVVVSRFGVIVGIEGPGWHWRLPYPFSKTRFVNIVVEHSFEADSTKPDNKEFMLTADINLIKLSCSVVYQIDDPVAYLTKIDQSSNLLSLVFEASVRELVTKMSLKNLQETIDKNTGEIHDPNTKQQAQKHLNALGSGVRIQHIYIREIKLPNLVAQELDRSAKDAQAQFQLFQATQTTAASNLIKAHILANQLQEQSQQYSERVNALIDWLNSQPHTLDIAQNTLDSFNRNSIIQFPLLFNSYTDLIDKIQPKQPPLQKLNSLEGWWRNRDIMRERDRFSRLQGGES